MYRVTSEACALVPDICNAYMCSLGVYHIVEIAKLISDSHILWKGCVQC
jgi:hypothetical protein